MRLRERWWLIRKRLQRKREPTTFSGFWSQVRAELTEEDRAAFPVKIELTTEHEELTNVLWDSLTRGESAKECAARLSG